MSKRTFKVGDIVSSEKEYAALPVGTTVWLEYGEPGSPFHLPDVFWTKNTDATWTTYSASKVHSHHMCPSDRVIRSLPVVDTTVSNKRKPASGKTSKLYKSGVIIKGEDYAKLPIGATVWELGCEPRNIDELEYSKQFYVKTDRDEWTTLNSGKYTSDELAPWGRVLRSVPDTKTKKTTEEIDNKQLFAWMYDQKGIPVKIGSVTKLQDGILSVKLSAFPLAGMIHIHPENPED